LIAFKCLLGQFAGGLPGEQAHELDQLNFRPSARSSFVTLQGDFLLARVHDPELSQFVKRADTCTVSGKI
jgi:hypothetical protein